jgi:hypothetical protein
MEGSDPYPYKYLWIRLLMPSPVLWKMMICWSEKGGMPNGFGKGTYVVMWEMAHVRKVSCAASWESAEDDESAVLWGRGECAVGITCHMVR